MQSEVRTRAKALARTRSSLEWWNRTPLLYVIREMATKHEGLEVAIEWARETEEYEQEFLRRSYNHWVSGATLPSRPKSKPGLFTGANRS